MNIVKKKLTSEHATFVETVLASRHVTYLFIGFLLATLPFLNNIGLIRGDTVMIFGRIVFFAIAALGLNVLLGYSGLISLGTAGFMGLGAYLTSHFTIELEWPFLLALPIAVIIPTILGLLVGLTSLRLAGMYLAIATLAISEVMGQVFVEIWAWTSLRPPLPNILYPIGVLELDRNGMYYFIVLLLVLLMILTDNFVHSPIGRALLTMRASEPAAQAMGINLFKYKLMAFGIATAYAALAGILYAHLIRAVDPSPWDLLLALQVLAVIVIGGLKTIIGPIIGAIVVFGVPPLILNNLPIIGDIAGLAFIFNGILIIVIILFYPRGLVYVGHDVRRLFSRREVETSGEEKASSEVEES